MGAGPLSIRPPGTPSKVVLTDVGSATFSFVQATGRQLELFGPSAGMFNYLIDRQWNDHADQPPLVRDARVPLLLDDAGGKTLVVFLAFLALLVTVIAVAFRERTRGKSIAEDDIAAQQAQDARVMTVIFSAIIGGMLLTVLTARLVFF